MDDANHTPVDSALPMSHLCFKFYNGLAIGLLKHTGGYAGIFAVLLLHSMAALIHHLIAYPAYFVIVGRHPGIKTLAFIIYPACAAGCRKHG